MEEITELRAMSISKLTKEVESWELKNREVKQKILEMKKDLEEITEMEEKILQKIMEK